MRSRKDPNLSSALMRSCGCPKPWSDGDIVGAGFSNSRDQTIAQHFAFAFDTDHSAGLEDILIAQTLISRRRNEDAAGLGMGFHATGEIHRIAPEIVSKFFCANHAGDNRSGVKPDTHPKGLIVDGAEARSLPLHGQREVGSG